MMLIRSVWMLCALFWITHGNARGQAPAPGIPAELPGAALEAAVECDLREIDATLAGDGSLASTMTQYRQLRSRPKQLILRYRQYQFFIDFENLIQGTAIGDAKLQVKAIRPPQLTGIRFFHVKYMQEKDSADLVAVNNCLKEESGPFLVTAFASADRRRHYLVLSTVAGNGKRLVLAVLPNSFRLIGI